MGDEVVLELEVDEMGQPGGAPKLLDPAHSYMHCQCLQGSELSQTTHCTQQASISKARRHTQGEC